MCYQTGQTRCFRTEQTTSPSLHFHGREITSSQVRGLEVKRKINRNCTPRWSILIELLFSFAPWLDLEHASSPEHVVYRKPAPGVIVFMGATVPGLESQAIFKI